MSSLTILPVYKDMLQSDLLEAAVLNHLWDGVRSDNTPGRHTFICIAVERYAKENNVSKKAEECLTAFIQSFLGDGFYSFRTYPSHDLIGLPDEEIQTLRFMWALNLVEYLRSVGE